MRKIISLILMLITACSIAIMNTSCALKDKATQLFCEHVFDQGEVTKAATCKSVGELTKTCTLCGKTMLEDIPTISHIEMKVEAKDATCSEKGHTDYVKCKVCDAIIVAPEELPVLGHKIFERAEVKATCLAPGLTRGEECSVCGEVFVAQEVINATGHSLVVVEGKEATCTSTGLTEGIKCEYCNTVYKSQETISILEHVDNDSNYVCDRCNTVLEDTINLSTASEVAVEVGDKVGGNWYRIYLESELEDYSYMYGVALNNLENVDGGTLSSLYVVSSLTTDSVKMVDFYYTQIVENVVADFPQIVSDTYIDFYLPMGLEIKVDFPSHLEEYSATVRISEDTTWGEYGEKRTQTFYRLNLGD